MKIEFKRLSEVARSGIIELMNNQLVRRQMPLAPSNFNEIDCERFIAAKEQLWTEHGYGPWAFVIDGRFGGWGGLQSENGEADLALVLHPNYWGVGKKIYTEIVRRAFDEMRFESLTVLLPPTRKKIKALFKLGFKEDGELRVDEERFIRYRLKK
ncbi:GNAT family N-acetyltransferase [Puniceicoccaceae bacterium K14]|nr:GNAT family N-acetyltransferase [Puniceicoccaceae bacterium K14]